MLVYNIGISGIRANQVALQTIANNIANADTEGYHRQQVQLTEQLPIVSGTLRSGTGVLVSGIKRLANAAADNALTLNLSQSADAQAQLDALQEIERLLTPSSGSLQSAVSTFFDAADQLATRPADLTLRREYVVAAQNVAQQVTSLNNGLNQLQQQQATAISDSVAQVNSLTQQIAAVQRQISVAQAGGSEPSTLMDQRDILINKLAELVDISPATLAKENGVLVGSGGWLVVSEQSPNLTVRQTDDGSLQLWLGDQGPVQPASGKLAGLLSSHNQIVPATRSALQEWTSAFISGVNSLQATGLGLAGPGNSVLGGVAVSNTTDPLKLAQTPFPVSNGSLAITVTNSSTGARKTYDIDIDPAADSLQDVVTRIDSLAHVQADISAAGQVRIAGDTGYTIDFTGRPDNPVDTSLVTGSSVPTVTGTYDGAENAHWTFTAIGSGQVGSTPDLKFQVTNSDTGEIIGVVDVGQGYAANTPIEIADGISIRFSSGTFATGDKFQLAAVSSPDTAGILNALGIGGIFKTKDFTSVTIDPAFLKHPELVAASITGNPSDAGQLSRLAEFRAARLLSSGTETLEDRLATITSNSGVDVNATNATMTQLQSQNQQLRDQQDSASGVDPNEELLAMLQFQRAFQANARFISSVNTALDDLLGLVR
jgi:flagellar hook-associated protein FlgK